MAVYTDVPRETLERFMAGYDLGPVLEFEGIAEGVENSNFRVDTERGRYILTLYEKRVQPADLPFFLDLMRHLAVRGVPSPTPVSGRDGRVLKQLCGRPAALVTFLPGRSPTRTTPAHTEALGAALAEFHLAGQDFPMARANDLALDGWERLADACAHHADTLTPGLRSEIESELAHFRDSWPGDLPRGVIHADLFPDNVFFEDGRITGLIDFYFSCNDLLAYDIAICMNAWCFEPDGQFNITKAFRMLEGYRARRALGAREIEALPLLARGAALRFLLTRLHDWFNQVDGALVRPKDPLEFLRKLRFHRGIRGPSAYGLA